MTRMADYRTIFPVQFLNVKGELTIPNHLVIKLVPLCQRCKLRAGKFSDRTEPQSVEGQSNAGSNPYHTNGREHMPNLQGVELHGRMQLSLEEVASMDIG